MKKLFITAFLMLTSLGIMAQEQEEQAVRKFTLMPKFGVNIAEFVNNSGSIYVDGSPRWGFTAGLEAECYLANRWGTHIGFDVFPARSKIQQLLWDVLWRADCPDGLHQLACTCQVVYVEK